MQSKNRPLRTPDGPQRRLSLGQVGEEGILILLGSDVLVLLPVGQGAGVAIHKERFQKN